MRYRVVRLAGVEEAGSMMRELIVAPTLMCSLRAACRRREKEQSHAAEAPGEGGCDRTEMLLVVVRDVRVACAVGEEGTNAYIFCYLKR